MSESKSSGGGIGIFGLLTVIFVCAKIFGWEPVASWDWWQVLIFPIIGTCLLVLTLVFGFIAFLLERKGY